MGLELAVEQRDKGVMLQLHGDIDTLTSPKLQACLAAELKEMPQVFVIDMSDVRYISSMGLRVFLSHLKRVKANNGSIVIAAASKLVNDVFHMSGFSNYFEMTPDVESAVAKLA
jgi:anti-anti-sigma factor